MRKEELKRQYYLLFVVIAAVTAFVFAMVGVLDSHAYMSLEQKKNVYGGWHVGIYNAADDVYQKLHNHAIVEEMGKMEIYGYAESFYGEKFHPVGSIDTIIKDMGRINLISGEMPDEKGEVAMEMDTLAALGYSYEPGQAITLKIHGLDKYGRRTVRQETFMLTGVVQNYSDVWKNSGNDLLNIFISPDYKKNLGVQSTNYFLEINEKYLSDISQIKVLLNEDRFIENNYISDEDVNDVSLLEEFLQEEIFVFLVIIFSVIMLVVLISTMINRRRESFALIRSIGAERKQIVSALIGEIVPVIVAGILVGTLTGITLPAVIFKILSYFLEDMIFMIEPAHAGMIAIGVLAGSFLTCLVGILGIFRIPMRGTIKYQTMGKGKNVRRRENFLSLFATFCMGCVFITSWYFCYLEYFEYRSFNKLYPYDYKLGYLPSYSESNVEISEETFEEIKKCYGVEYARAYKISPYYEVIWEDMEDSIYAEKLSLMQNPHLPEEKQSAGKVFTRVYEIQEDDERAFLDYQEQIDEGQITFDEIQNSNKVIIYLPTLYEYDDGVVVADKNYEYWIQSKEPSAYNVDTIGIGEKIKIQGDRGEIEVEIAAIIYDNQVDSRIPICMPFSCIMGNSMGEKINCIDGYLCVEVYEKNNFNRLQTEIELIRFQDLQTNFENRLSVREKIFGRLLLHVGIIGVMNTIVLIFMIIFKGDIIDNQSSSEVKKNLLLYTLGVSKFKLFCNYMIKESYFILYAILFSITGVLYYCIYRDYVDRYGVLINHREDYYTFVVILYKAIVQKYDLHICIIGGLVYAVIILSITFRTIKKLKLIK